MDTIWTEAELKKIKPILKKFNLTLNKDNNIINDTGNINEDIGNFSYHNQIEELNILLYHTSKDEITKVLKLIIGIKYMVSKNPNHPIFNGLINELTNINIKDNTEIFKVLIAIIALYKRTSNNLSQLIVNKLQDPFLIQEKIQEIKNSDIETKEELYIKNYVSKILNLTNGINETKIFKPIIDKYNNNIKNELLLHLNIKLKYLVKRNAMETERNTRDYICEILLKKRKENEKRSYGNDFMDK